LSGSAPERHPAASTFGRPDGTDGPGAGTAAAQRQSDEQLWTQDQAAAYLGVSVRTLQRMRAAGEIGFMTVGTGTRRPRVRFCRRHLIDFEQSSEQFPSALPAARRA
jgi:excisionase family DNA binding protein